MTIIVSGEEVNSELASLLYLVDLGVETGIRFIINEHGPHFIWSDPVNHRTTVVFENYGCLEIMSEVLMKVRCNAIATTGVPVLVLPVRFDTQGRSFFKSGVYKLADPAQQNLFIDVFEHIARTMPERPIHDMLGAIILNEPDKATRVLYQTEGVLPGLLKFLAPFERLGLKRVTDFFKEMKRGLIGFGVADPSNASTGVIAIETCNRMCGHCATLGSPRLPSFDKDSLERWLNIIPPAGQVGFTYGEPFTCAELPDLIRIVLGYPTAEMSTIVTSGISSRAKELEIAEKLSRFDELSLARLSFLVTISDYTHLRGHGFSEIESARDMQLRALRTGVLAGSGVFINSFLGIHTLRDQILEPFFSSHIPLAAVNWLVLTDKFLGLREGRERRCGRWAVNAPNPGFDEIMYTSGDCHSDSSRLGVALFADGSVGPGCCSLTSQHVSLGNMRDIASRDQATEMVLRFNQALSSALSEEKVTDCVDCTALAATLPGGSVRHMERFRRVVGPANTARLERKMGEFGRMRRC